MSIVPPNFGSGAEVQATQDGARRRAEGVTPLLPQARKVVGATGFEPATPCAQDTFSAFSCDFLHFPISA